MGFSLKPALTEGEIERIHNHSLDILERVGVDFKTTKALDVLQGMGCSVDFERNWASLPRDLVEWSLGQAPRTVQLGARDPGRDVILDGSRSHHTTDSQGTQAIDLETGACRPSTADDLRFGLRFADALSMVEIVNVMVAANDVPSHLRTVAHFAMAFEQTSKHVRTGVLNARQVPFIVEMARAAAGDGIPRPIFSAVDCTISPLMHDGPMTEACIELAKLGVPIMVYPMPLAGGTSPVTMAGTALVHNAEFLSGLVLLQAVNPGAPVIYGTGASQLDMQTGRYGGSADGHGCKLMLRELARHYDLPVNMDGLTTSSASLDGLYGYEAASACLLACLAGADEIYSIGLLGSAQVLSLDKMVFDNHLAREIEIMVRSIPVDEDHLQADLVESVGIGGHYLTRPETRRYTKEEYVPLWPGSGKGVLDLVREEVVEILHGHQPASLPDGASERIAEIMREADAELA